MTKEEIEKRKDAQEAIMQEKAFAIVFDGSGRTFSIAPPEFNGTGAVHLHALAISDLQEILSCYGCTCGYLGLEPGDSETTWVAIAEQLDKSSPLH